MAKHEVGHDLWNRLVGSDDRPEMVRPDRDE